MFSQDKRVAQGCASFRGNGEPSGRKLETGTAWFLVAHESRLSSIGWVLPPLCNSWRKFIAQLYIALKKTPSIAFYRAVAVPKVSALAVRNVFARLRGQSSEEAQKVSRYRVLGF